MTGDFYVVPVTDFCHWLARGWQFPEHPKKLPDPLADMGHRGYWSIVMFKQD